MENAVETPLRFGGVQGKFSLRHSLYFLALDYNLQKTGQLDDNWNVRSTHPSALLPLLPFWDLHSFAAGHVTNQYLLHFVSFGPPNYLQVPLFASNALVDACGYGVYSDPGG